MPYQLTDGGTTILVPQDKVYATRLQMSGEGLPVGDNGGYALLDKQGLTTSEFQQQVGYQRALEGELKKTIESLDGVRAAAVHLAIPQKDVFTSDKEQPDRLGAGLDGLGQPAGQRAGAGDRQPGRVQRHRDDPRGRHGRRLQRPGALGGRATRGAGGR